MNPPETTVPVLLIISDRPHVWRGFRAPGRDVRRWLGERESDEERAQATNFTGDPTDPATYDWAMASRDLSAVVDLADDERAAGAIEALRRIRPEAGVLVITANDQLDASQIEVSRRLAWTDALRGDLEGELRQLEALRRLCELRKFASGDGDVAILVHPDPDPDALASALALRALLRRDPDSTPIVTMGDMTRPENRRMSELLRMRVTRVTEAELHNLPRVVAVDFQPIFLCEDDGPRIAIIDHHPCEKMPRAAFVDIRPHYGATATMMTEYLRVEDERRIAEPLATALLYGIKTDTDTLSRGSISNDVEAYAFLQAHADLPLLRRLERSSYSIETARVYGNALMNIATEGDIAAVFLGAIADDDAHVLADIADFCLALEQITWAIAAAVIDDNIVLTIRHLGGAEGAGDLAKAITEKCGSGGGHAIMARAVIPAECGWQDLAAEGDEASSRLVTIVAGYLEGMRVSRRSSHPARPATVPS